MLSIFREIKTCTIELLNDFINFRIIIIKLYLKKSDTFIQDFIQDSIQDLIQNSIQDFIQDFIQDLVQEEDITLRYNSSRSRQRLTHFQNINIINITIYIFKFISPFANFQTSRLKKLNELLEKRIFKIIYIDDLFIEARVFENRFVNQIKNEGTEKAFEKSRFVI